jgi:hypothetical protein
MNNLLSFWLAPVTALFLPSVYRDAIKRSARDGVFYILYQSLMSGVLFMLLMLALVWPAINEFSNWTRNTMPVLIWTPSGLSLEDGGAARWVHPVLGPIVNFDMSKTVVDEVDMGRAYFFVTSTKIFFKRGSEGVDNFDITAKGAQKKYLFPPKVRIAGETIVGLLNIAKGVALLATPLLVAILSFFFILIVNLIFSLIGLLLNKLRKEKLLFRSVFSLTCFATTASVVVAWVHIMTPLRRLPLPLGWMMLINLIYMFLAFRVTARKN